MKLSIAMAAALICAAVPAAAQTRGRVSVGVGTTFLHTTDSDVDSAVTVGPIVRLNPREGWGPAAGLNWFRADVVNPAGRSGDFVRLRIRPLMGGVSYNLAAGRLMTSFSVIGGPSFNKAELLGPHPGESIEIERSIAIRPAVGVTVTVAPRVALIGMGGYVINRPNIVYRNASGQELVDRWKADAVILHGGIVFSLF